MSVSILTGYDDSFAHIGDITTPAKKLYASRYFYNFECVRRFEPSTHPSWQKLRLIYERFNSLAQIYDWIFWMDADGVLTNPDLSVESHIFNCPWYKGEDFIASIDWSEGSPWNAGHFLIKNTHEMREFIKACLWHEEEWGNRAFWDQSAMQDHIRPNLMALLPRRKLMAVPRACRDAAPEPWEPGDFIAHCTMDDQDARKRIIQELTTNPHEQPR